MNKLVKELAVKLEAVATTMHMHVGLTGGQLYKHGERKDIDFVVYTEHQKEDVPRTLHEFMKAADAAIEEFEYTFIYGYVCKAVYKEAPIDVLYPQYHGGGYYKNTEMPNE